MAAVRNTEKASSLTKLGVQLRQADYTKPETLGKAFAGVEKVLLISSSEIGQRFAQHQHVIDAAVAADVKLLVYTSILRADTSSLSLATEHLATEKAIQASGLPFCHPAQRMVLGESHGIVGPCATVWGYPGRSERRKVRFRRAGAAAAILTNQGHENKVYELAGDESFTLSELAAEVSEVAKTTVVYRDLPQKEYEKALLKFGLPMPIAAMLADSDVGAAKGDLDSQSGDLRSLIGRPTTSLIEAIRSAV